VIARVAESCFWLQRHVERFDNTARLLAINLETLLDVELPPEERWRPLLAAAGEEARFLELHGPRALDDGDQIQDYLTWNEANPVSIARSAEWARENARTIRETLSLEAWETLNRFWLWLSGGPGKRLYRRDRESFYEKVRQEALLFRGVCQETMPHDRPFDFLRLGTSLERAGQIARTLDVKYNQMAPIHRGEAYEGSDQLTLWLALLRCSGTSEAFFKRGYPLDGKYVAGFMIFERDHPRTILYNVERCWNFLQRIRPFRGSGYSSAKLVLGLRQELRQATIDEVLDRGVDRFLASLIGALDLVADAIRRDFFYAPAEPAAPAVEAEAPVVAPRANALDPRARAADAGAKANIVASARSSAASAKSAAASATPATAASAKSAAASATPATAASAKSAAAGATSAAAASDSSRIAP
jgi:uncharacterized alpha-E superfamily protein